MGSRSHTANGAARGWPPDADRTRAIAQLRRRIKRLRKDLAKKLQRGKRRC